MGRSCVFQGESQAVIGAQIGLDRFLAWRIPLAVATVHVPPKIDVEPVHSQGEAWLLFAAARLERLRLGGMTLRHKPQIAGWLIPCRIPGGRIGNWFLSAYSDDPLTVLAMRGIGLEASRCRIHHTATHIHAVGEVTAVVGRPIVVPELAWFTEDRCGLFPRWGGVLCLPLAKRRWAWQVHAGELQAPLATRMQGRPVGVIDCSHDLAL